MDLSSGALARSDPGLGHGSGPHGSPLAEVNNLSVGRDLNLIVDDLFLKIGRDDLQASVVQLFVVAQEIPSVLHEAGDPVIEVLMEIIKLRAPRPVIQCAPGGILHDRRASLKLFVQLLPHPQPIAFFFLRSSAEAPAAAIHRLSEHLGQERLEVDCNRPGCIAKSNVE